MNGHRTGSVLNKSGLLFTFLAVGRPDMKFPIHRNNMATGRGAPGEPPKLNHCVRDRGSFLPVAFASMTGVTTDEPIQYC